MALRAGSRVFHMHQLRSLGAAPQASMSTERVLLHGQHDLPAEPSGIIECREYTLRPAGLVPYLQLLSQHAEQRKRLSPFLG